MLFQASAASQLLLTLSGRKNENKS